MNLACLWSCFLCLSQPFFSLISPLFPSQCPYDKIFLHMSTDSTLQCEAIWSVQEIFMHATYVSFHQLPSVGLPGFFRKFSCTRPTYQLNRQIPGLAQARPNNMLCGSYNYISLTQWNFHYTHSVCTLKTYTHTKETQGNAILAIHIIANGILAVVHY